MTCACALITLVLLANLGRSRIGRTWRAVRDDEVAAALAGLNVARLRVLAFVVSAACAGLGGALLAVVTAIVSPGAYTLTLSIGLLTAAVLGGLGSLAGAVWGSLRAGPRAHLPHQRGGQPRAVRRGQLQRADRRLRRRADRRHARLPGGHPGRPAPPASGPAAPAAGRPPGQRLAPAARRPAEHQEEGPHEKTTSSRRRGRRPALAAVAMLARRLRLERQLGSSSGSELRADRLGARHHRDHDHDRQPPAAHRRRRARLRRDRPASNAYFQYVNAHGGIYGRKIVYKYLNDQYNPTITSTVVHQLVLQDNVYAIFNGLGTPTHLAVVPFLNAAEGARRVRRLRLRVLEQPAHLPGDLRLAARLRPRGQDPRQVHQAALQGQEDRLLLPGRRVRPGRRQGPGLRDPEVRRSSPGRAYDPTNTNIGPQVAALKAAGAQVVVSFSVPAFTALLQAERAQARASTRSSWSATSAPTRSRWPACSRRSPSRAAPRCPATR